MTEMGYKKPPMHSRFKTGESGNLKGRPKGRRNFKTDLLEELQETIVITESGEPKSMTKQRLLIRLLATQSMKGDTAAMRLLLNTMQRVLGEEEIPEDPELCLEDQEILAHYLKVSK